MPAGYAEDMAPDVPSGTLRDVTRAAVRDRIAAIAVARFDHDGFDAVTVEQVAADAGISARSFHRYFPAKEDAVIGDPTRHRGALAAAFAGRPTGEQAWDSLCEAFVEMLTTAAEPTEVGRRSVRVMRSTASLRARNLEKHLAWAEALVPLVAARLDDDDPEFRADALVQAALGCFDVAIGRWAEGPAEGDAVALLRRAFAAVRTS